MRWCQKNLLLTPFCIYYSCLFQSCRHASALCFSTPVGVKQMYPIYNVIILVISLLRSLLKSAMLQIWNQTWQWLLVAPKLSLLASINFPIKCRNVAEKVLESTIKYWHVCSTNARLKACYAVNSDGILPIYKIAFWTVSFKVVLITFRSKIFFESTVGINLSFVF